MGRIRNLITSRRHSRMLKVWDEAIGLANQGDLGELRGLRNLARQQRRRLDQFLHLAEGRLHQPLDPDAAFQKPMFCDWAFRPDLWSGPLSEQGGTAIEPRHMLGSDTTIFHDCGENEISARQLVNAGEGDQAPYGLRLDVFQFKGNFLSLAIDLPAEGLEGLTLTHVIRVAILAEVERPMTILARLNVKHGPNTEQVLGQFPMAEMPSLVEFDLAYTKVNETRIEKLWVDILFEDPAMNQITLRDLTITRRPRSEL